MTKRQKARAVVGAMQNKPRARIDCRHEIGWCAEERVFLYIGADAHGNNVFLNHSSRNKIVMSCNRCDCNAYRNVYFDRKNGALKTWGTVRYHEYTYMERSEKGIKLCG